ncbi:MAG: c-type cytochrome [Acidimicrobiia bacterium]|nr:c-type cytochrome [Acidimicrobiia bacterium]
MSALMRRREWLARLALVLVIVGLPVSVLGYQYILRPALATVRIIDIHAAVPEAGGFSPDTIRVAVGETVTLRFAAVDVTHGVAIGPGLGVDLGHIDPGMVKEVTLAFDHSGTFTYYCTTWCSPNHWRMRGVIEVRDTANPGALPTPQRDPVIEALATEGVDIDANVHRGEEDPAGTSMPALATAPSAARGAATLPTLNVPPELQNPDWRRAHTPARALELLAAANAGVDAARLVDAIAALWMSAVSLSELETTGTVYDQNCAACHGQVGGGDGPAATFTAERPAAFSDPAYMFTMRSDVLYAKIRRGGMGTDMPNFGTLFTAEETWALVRYLWALTFAPEAVQ